MSTRAADAANDAVRQGKAALTQSREQFIEDERPYMWMDTSKGLGPFSIEPPGMGDNAGKVRIDIEVKNFGKSPALKVHSFGYISVTGSDPENDIRWPQMKGKFIAVGGGVYPPEDTFFKSVRSDEVADPITAQFINARTASTTKTPITLHLRIEYFDRSGTKYVSEICERMQANHVSVRCQDHNQIK